MRQMAPLLSISGVSNIFETSIDTRIAWEHTVADFSAQNTCADFNDSHVHAPSGADLTLGAMGALPRCQQGRCRTGHLPSHGDEEESMFLYKILPILALCSVCGAQCSMENVRGTWVTYTQGSTMYAPPGNTQPVSVPMVGMGIGRFDYKGGVGTANINTSGQLMTGSTVASVVVNPDCIGTFTFMGNMGGQQLPAPLVERVIVMNGEMWSMPISGPLSASNGIEYWRRISVSDPQCTPDMVRGVYAGTWTGTFITTPPGQKQAVPMPFTLMSAMTLDYGGKGTGNGTMSLAGNVSNYVFTDASVTVNPDCTGTTRWKGGLSGSAMTDSGVEQIVVLNNGDEIISFQTQNSAGTPIILGTLKRISNTPVPPNW